MIADRVAAVVDADLPVVEELLELHVPVLDARDLGDADDLPGAAAQALRLDDEVHGRSDLLEDGPGR